MADPIHSRKLVDHRIGSTNSCGSMIQSTPAKKLQRKALRLPVTQTETGLNESELVPSLVESLTPVNDSQDISENWSSEVPQSAPPVMNSQPVFRWPSPKRIPQDAEFFDWSNGTTTISPSPSRHQDGDCSIRMASGNKQGRNENASNPCPKEVKTQNSADGAATTTTDQTSWSRKPPHHLPPLDPSLFKTKSKSTKALSSREKKTKRCASRPIEVESSNELSSENDSKSTNKAQKKIELSDKQSSATSHSIKQNSSPTCVCHSVDGGNDDLLCNGTLQKAQRIVPCNTRALRRSRSISSSIELLSSKKTGVDARAGISNGSFIQKSRARLGPNLQSTASSPLPAPETAGHGKRSERFSIRRTATIHASGRTFECDRNAYSRTGGGETPSVPSTQAIPTEFQHTHGIATEESHVEGKHLPCNSQPGPSSCAYWRVRKAGVCSQVQSSPIERERTQARVLMKKFGSLDIKKD